MLALTFALPGAKPRALRIRRGTPAARLAAFLRAFARQRGVSVHAVDWSVVRVAA